MCIEYQGEQHYKPNFFINKFGKNDGMKRFEQLHKHDQIKKTYCKTSNIKFLEITYKDNIDDKLETLIKQLGIKG